VDARFFASVLSCTLKTSCLMTVARGDPLTLLVLAVVVAVICSIPSVFSIPSLREVSTLVPPNEETKRNQVILLGAMVSSSVLTLSKPRLRSACEVSPRALVTVRCRLKMLFCGQTFWCHTGKGIRTR